MVKFNRETQLNEWMMFEASHQKTGVASMNMLMTKREVGEALSCHPETVMRWVRDGSFPAPIKPGGTDGGQCRWSTKDIEDWLTERRNQAKGDVS